MTTPIKWGSDFLVNTTTAALQNEPSISALADGRFVVVWVDFSATAGDTSGGAIRGQIFNADGTKQFGEFRVNSVTAGAQVLPAVAAQPGGGFVVTWQTATGDASGSAIAGQVFDANGAKVGGEFVANTTTLDNQITPSAAGFANGQFVLAWIDAGGASTDVKAQIFDASGTKSGAEILINSTTASAQLEPAVATLANGTFVAVWTDYSKTGGDTSEGAIRARLFTSAGAPIAADFIVNTTTDSAQLLPQVTALSGGRFLVTWTDYSRPTEEADLRGQIFNHDGSRAGTEFLMSAETKGLQTFSVVAALPDGGFVVAWQNQSARPDNLLARVFAADGTPKGLEFAIDPANSSTQHEATIAVLPDGRFVVAFAQDGGGDVRAQIFDPREGAVHFAGTALRDQHVGTSYDDTLQGGADVDWLMGAEGNDTLSGDAGGDFLDGGAGVDTASYAGSAEDVEVNLGTGLGKDGDAEGDVLAGIENLIGSNHSDELLGDGGDNVLSGLGGLDLLKGGGGNDTLIGGADDDLLDGGEGDDTAVFAESFDHYRAGTGAGGDIGLMTTTGFQFEYLRDVEHLQFADGRIDIEDGIPHFDNFHYLSENRDVYHAGVDAFAHYNEFGWHEGRDPSAFFDTSGYLAVNRDVAAAGINPLEHYHQIGWREGRDPSADFDTTLYLLRNPDVAAAGMDPLAHYLQFGIKEERPIYAAVGPTTGGFDAQYYLLHNPDVAAAAIDPLFHFNAVGWREGRDPNGWFDTDGYLAYYTDVAAAGINPFDHYMAVGWKEGRDAATWFDTRDYLAANSDVAAAGVNPLDHFLQFGIYEGRQAVNDHMWG
jgi:Ca2+-binding RTX toxin-like protein